MIALEQNTEEWLEFRKTKIGSSDAPIIMGESPWKTPQQLWEEKMGLRESSYESAAMHRGKQLEPAARKAFEKETGLVVWPNVLIHPEHEFIIASLDGITMDGKAAVEIKCPGEKTHQMALSGEIPKHYQIQMQHQLAVTGLQEMFYYSYDGQRGVTLKVQRDNALIKALLEKEQEFFRYMKESTPPETQRSDLPWLKRAEQWKAIQLQKKTLKEQEENCRAALIDLTENGTSQGGGVRLTQYSRKGRIAYEKIPILQEIDLEPYRQATIQAWKITVE
ncbi:MAG: YqaJ viral recombinase family protein [Simkaniaceae bacterium]|nr:YqaJ viral recombinase family protein [Candidatus Sacchlamyda saccharinae]